MKQVRQNSQFQKALSLTLIYSLVAPTFIRADGDEPSSSTKSAIMQLGSMNQANAALQNLNKAMATAAINPNDEWRREEVRKAVQAVPGAVQGVAGTFAVNTLGNSALPFVLSTLGSAVDVNAPNSFDKHLKNPNPEGIQKSSDSISSSERPEFSTYVVKEEARSVEIPSFRAPSNQLAVISEVSSIKEVPVFLNEAPEKVETRSELRSSTEPTSSNSTSSSAADVISSIREDIAIAEEAYQQLELVKSRELSSKDEPELFLEKSGKKEEKTRDKKRPIKLKPTSWILAPLFYLASWEVEARAQVGQPGTGNPMNGTPTNPGDQGGGGAGQVLFGIAAIMAAVSPMIVASTEAKKEQNVATIQAEAQIKQAEIQTNTQKEMAQMSAQTAMSQAQVQQDVAKMNNDAQTERLQINLAAAQQQRNEQRQAEAEQITIQRQLEAQKLALAMQQADQQILQARQSIEAQKLQMALSGSKGASNDLNSAQTKRTTGGSPLAAALAAQAITDSSASADSFQGTNGLKPSATQTARGLANPTNRLLASVDDGVLSEVENIPDVRTAVARTSLVRRSLARRGLNVKRVPLTNARGFYRNGLSLAAGGSFAEGRSLTQQRDLARFSREIEQQSESQVFESRRALRQTERGSSH